MDACMRRDRINEGALQMMHVNTARGNLHRHLQGYAGQTLSYEMVKELMSFVFDMVKDPSVSWNSQDSHIRLLNGIFKKVGQVLDDRSIDNIEESILTSFVFPSPSEKPAGLVKMNETPVPARPKESPAPALSKGSASNQADYETFYRRLHVELVAFENRFTRLAEAASLESREALKRSALDRIELESRLATEREERAGIHSNEHAEYLACLEMQQAELLDLMNRFLKSQEDRSRQADHAFDARMKAMGALMETSKDKIEAMLQEHAQTQAAAAKKAESQQEARFREMEQKLLDMDGKAGLRRKAVKRANAAVIINIILTLAGFGAVIYFLNVH